jgi:hypothetical protein
MARKALYLYVISVGFMQLHAVGLLFFTETMAVQAHAIGYLARLLGFLFMARLFAACVVGNKLGMVDCHQPTFDEPIRHLVTVLTTRLD